MIKGAEKNAMYKNHNTALLTFLTIPLGDCFFFFFFQNIAQKVLQKKSEKSQDKCNDK